MNIPKIHKFIRTRVGDLNGVTIGISGGLDSAVVLKLCLDALGNDRIVPVYLPCNDHVANKPFVDSLKETYKIQIPAIEISPISEAIFKQIDKFTLTNKLTEMNIKARVRMTILYGIANSKGLLVAGTSNKSELLTGYFTKYGDGGCDFEPIGHLYKTEVRELARSLRVPQQIIDRPPSAGLYEGQTDEADLGMTYEELDEILEVLEITYSKGLGFKMDEPAEKVIKLIEGSQHKRRMPRTPED